MASNSSSIPNNNITFNVNAPKRKERPKSAILHFIAGGAGGAVGVVLTSPLEVIKTQLQAANSAMLHVGKPAFVPTTPFALYNLVLRDGFRGMFKGLGPHLLGVVPARAVHFWSYNLSKKILNKLGMKDGTPMYTVAAVSAGCTVAAATSPIWLVKTRMQLQTSLKGFSGTGKKLSTAHGCIKVLKEDGIFGFYKGLGASMVGVTESVFQFVIYERLKERLMHEKKKQPEIYPFPDEMSTIECLTTAAISKLIAAVTTYPHEVVRTRLRENLSPLLVPRYTTVMQTMVMIVRMEGPKALFGGMGAHLARVVPNSSIMFLTYELVIDIFNRINKTATTIMGTNNNNNSSSNNSSR